MENKEDRIKDLKGWIAFHSKEVEKNKGSSVQYHEESISIYQKELNKLDINGHFCQYMPTFKEPILNCWERNGELFANLSEDTQDRSGFFHVMFCPICGKKAGE